MMERSKTMKRAALALVTALALPAGLAAGTTVDQKHPAAPDGEVTIENMAGSIKVTGWDRAEVQVQGTIADSAELEITGSERKLHVEVAPEHNPMAKSDIEVMVPAGSSVSIEGFQATITVTGVSGSVTAETVNGSITHAGPSKDVSLQSVNGAVETTKGSGRVNAEAVNGPITVRDASGELEASTVNGKLTVAGGSFTRAHVEAVGGGVRFDAALAPKATLSVESVSGPVDLFFPAGFGGDFTVTTFSGTVVNELGPAAEKTSEFTPQKELSFTSGSGGVRVSVETLSGAVNIRKRQ
jgi:type VI protein secretion system component Hcp